MLLHFHCHGSELLHSPGYLGVTPGLRLAPVEAWLQFPAGFEEKLKIHRFCVLLYLGRRECGVTPCKCLLSSRGGPGSEELGRCGEEESTRRRSGRDVGQWDIPRLRPRAVQGRYELSPGTKPALEKAWMIPPAPWRGSKASGKGLSSSSSREDDGEAGAPQERRCSPGMKLTIA